MFRKYVLFESKLLCNRLRALQGRGFFHGKHGGDQLTVKPNPSCKTKNPPKLNYKVLTMDDMLVPSGSWKENYKKKNIHYNGVLVLGFASLIGSIYILNETTFFNAFPPPYPFIKDTVYEDDKEYLCVDENEDDCDCEC